MIWGTKSILPPGDPCCLGMAGPQRRGTALDRLAANFFKPGQGARHFVHRASQTRYPVMPAFWTETGLCKSAGGLCKKISGQVFKKGAVGDRLGAILPLGAGFNRLEVAA